MTTTIAETLETAAKKLGEVSDTPRLDAEVLLAMATGKKRTHFRAWPEKPLTFVEDSKFQGLLEKRLAGHPIAHLAGIREFWSREFIVTPDVLIPRPETELLVELALWLNSTTLHPMIQIADLGTGSGAIAISLALELPSAAITALDLSPTALSVATENASRLGASNIRFIRSDWFNALHSEERFDLIVSNPPYIAEFDPHLQQGDVRFEPNLALASGSDGLDAIRTITKEATNRLNAGGWLLFEHGYDQAHRVVELLRTTGFEEIVNFPDLQGHVRVSGGRIGRGGLPWVNGGSGF